MARKYVNPYRTPPELAAFEGAVQDAAERQPARDVEELRRQRPGMALDAQPWAKSWGAFMDMLRDEQGQRQVSAAIRNAGLSETVPSEGGFLVPWSLTKQVFAYLSEAVIWPRCMRLQMSASRLALPVLDNSNQSNGAQALAGIQFGIVNDGDPIPASSPKWGEQRLEARKLAALVSPVPDELADDAMPAFSDLFGRVIGEGLGWEADELFFNGDGLNEPQGILDSPAALPVTRANSGQAPVHADVVALLKATHPASKKRLTWLMSSDVFDSLLELYEVVGTAPTGQDITPPGTLRFNSERGTWELLGVECEITDHQPQAGTAGDLAVADLGLYAAGIWQGLTIERSSKGATFASGSSAWRIRTRIDGRYLPQSTYTLPNGKTAGVAAVLS